MKKLFAVSAVLCAALWGVAATGCLVISENPKDGGAANITLKMQKVGALQKGAASSAIEMSFLQLTLRAPGETTRNEVIPISGHSQQTSLRTYANLSSKKTWTLQAVARDINGVTIYQDSVKFTVPAGGTTDVNLTLSAKYSMLRASFYPIRDSVARCELWVNGTMVDDSTFAPQSLLGDTVVLTRDYLLASTEGVATTVRMDVYGDWYGEADALLYRGETTIMVRSGQDVAQNITLTWVGTTAPIGQGKINVSLGTVGTLAVKGYLDPRFWRYMGGNQFSQGGASYLSVALSGDDQPYVAYQDWENGNKATVMRRNGSAWEYLGTPGFSAGDAAYVSLALSGGDVPYVAFQDGANGNKATVMRRNGSAWEYLGTPGFSAGDAAYVSLALSGGDVPYVAFQDGANGNKVTVMRWNGSAWEYVGSPGFSGSATYVSLALSADGTPYVAFQDGANGNKATVMRWNGSAWEYVGSPGFSGSATYVSLALSADGTPYVAFRENGGYASAMRWNGSAWEYVGTPGFSPAYAASLSLALSSNGTPYVAFQDRQFDAASYSTTIMRLNGDAWETVGRPRFSPAASSIYMALSGSDVPYVAFSEYENGSKVSVMNFAP